MFVIDTIGFWNTLVPLAVLGLLAVLLPRVLVDRETRSHGKLLHGIALTAAFLVAIGFMISIAVTQMRGFEAVGHFEIDPLGAVWVHLRLSLMTAIVWGPVLGLVWFGLAQGVEARRGQDIAKGDW
ncbi:hypothetical protein J7399_09010 [Shimia sp. R9_1]|uniref:hypothetical protein n=1 Tax=unclassified Shimia TaxID=2630038 RepID=UPI001AD98D77|nr:MULTISPECIES: hypothetical protein [unclassified Shimia]MBO9399669.1 hypothetical protein [Shimia sp. R9_3]MBO9407565.1 hypothetical protein [Shimia sp. R9_1]